MSENNDFNFDNFEEDKINTGNDIGNSNGAADTPKDTPQADFFNSAGNTKLESEETAVPEVHTDEKKEAFKGQKVKLGKLISGKAAVTIVNIFIPSFIVFALTKMGYAANKSQLKLTNEEKEILSPVVQDCLDYIVVNFDNPFYTLAFVASMIYGAKIFDAIPDLKKIIPEIDTDKAADKMLRKVANSPMIPAEYSQRNNAGAKVPKEYEDIRKKIEATTIRKEQVKLTIEALEFGNPADLIEAWGIYRSIYPERIESYFRSWYDKNYEKMPAQLRFYTKEPPADNIDDFNLGGEGE